MSKHVNVTFRRIFRFSSTNTTNGMTECTNTRWIDFFLEDCQCTFLWFVCTRVRPHQTRDTKKKLE